MKREKLTVFDGILLALTVILGLVLLLATPAAKEAWSNFHIMPYLLLRAAVHPIFLICLGYTGTWLPVFLSGGTFTLNKASRTILLVLAICIVFIYAVAILDSLYGIFHMPKVIRGEILQNMNFLVIAGIFSFFCTHFFKEKGAPDNAIMDSNI